MERTPADHDDDDHHDPREVMAMDRITTIIFCSMIVIIEIGVMQLQAGSTIEAPKNWTQIFYALYIVPPAVLIGLHWFKTMTTDRQPTIDHTPSCPTCAAKLQPMKTTPTTEAQAKTP